MNIPLLDLSLQYRELKDELDAAWSETMESAAFIGGTKVREFEQQMAKACQTEFCVSCANGTDALYLILRGMGIGEGDEVITTPFTFFATAEAIVHAGATPIFVDIEPDTYNIDSSKIDAAISRRTKAIMPVHIFGQCADMDPVLRVAKEHGLLVIEDACQAIGATYRGKRAGSLGDAAGFSFFPSKNLGCAGDGGCVTTNDEALAVRVRKIASHGTSRKYFHDAFGVNSRLDALQASILLVKLPHLDGWNGQRRGAARVYDEMLADVDDLRLPVERDYGESVYHLYVVKSARAGDILPKLQQAGVGSSLYYPLSLHEQDVFAQEAGYRKPYLPVSESCDGTTFALPAYPGITSQQQAQVAQIVRSALQGDSVLAGAM